jgi:hypothetical protein
MMDYFATGMQIGHRPESVTPQLHRVSIQRQFDGSPYPAHARPVSTSHAPPRRCFTDSHHVLFIALSYP